MGKYDEKEMPDIASYHCWSKQTPWDETRTLFCNNPIFFAPKIYSCTILSLEKMRKDGGGGIYYLPSSASTCVTRDFECKNTVKNTVKVILKFRKSITIRNIICKLKKFKKVFEMFYGQEKEIIKSFFHCIRLT